MHTRLGHLGGHRQGDRPGPGAQVDHPRRASGGADLLGPLDGPAGQQLGLRARHEHARSDGQLEVAERGRAGQVLQGLAGGTTTHQRLERRALLGAHLLRHRPRPAGDQGELRAGGAQDVGQQLGRVVLRAGHAGLGEHRGRLGDQLPHAVSSASSRAVRSASRQDPINGPSAPSSTWSRL